MPNPAIAMKMGIKVNMKRCRNRSERNAIAFERPKAAAHGGIESSCVLTSEVVKIDLGLARKLNKLLKQRGKLTYFHIHKFE